MTNKKKEIHLTDDELADAIAKIQKRNELQSQVNVLNDELDAISGRYTNEGNTVVYVQDDEGLSATCRWTPILSPEQISKIYGRSFKSLKPDIESGKIVAKKFSTKKYQLRADQLPPGWYTRLRDS